jgi:threonine dehydrogenase-like Zn-dependent dehydrogenase
VKANCWISPNKVEVQDVPDPKILNGRDAIVRITSSAICGSDLHLLDGYVPTMQEGDVMGHEFMGEVVEVGSGVDGTKLRVGDRVVVPFPIACGACGDRPDPGDHPSAVPERDPARLRHLQEQG